MLDYVRIAYVASQAFALAVYYYTSSKVRPNVLQRLTVTTPHLPQIKAKNDQTMLKYGVYRFLRASIAANASLLINHPQLAQSSRETPSYVNVRLSSPGTH